MSEPNVVHTHQLHIPPRKGVDEPAIVANISIRTGATPELIVHILDHFAQAVIALWHGFRPVDEIWGKRSSCGVENTTGEALVLIWSNEVFMLLPNGKRKKVSINKFHEKTTALECVMQMEMSQNAINDFHKLVLEGYEREVANEGETPATLQPDTPYPDNPTIERIMTRPPAARLDRTEWGKRQAPNKVVRGQIADSIYSPNEDYEPSYGDDD